VKIQLNTALYQQQIAKFMAATDNFILHDDAEINRAALCLKAMSHPLRLKILCILGNSSISVQDIVEQVGTSQSNISQHLAVLRDKGILDSKKEANRVYYFIDDERVTQLIRLMRAVFCGTESF
jgi:ArsR family transcriptional regulator